MSKVKSRQYKPTTIRRLDTLSGNKCASPECNKALIARDGESIISKICHIEAASPKGSRFNSSMSNDDRRHFDNLILLCDECHTIIDNKKNESKYTVSLLKEWKCNHENKQLNNLLSHPTLLGAAINAIINSNIQDESVDAEKRTNSFSISEKIKFNDIKRNKALIEEYKAYHVKISSIYSELEDQGSFKKEKLLRIIRTMYLKNKGKYISNHDDPIKFIKAHADDIIEDVENDILESISIDQSNFIDDISFGATMIMVDAFMRCKILEEPVKND